MNFQSNQSISSDFELPPKTTKILLTLCLFSFEFCFNFVCLPFSLANFLIILRTKIIHSNLKFILLSQSITIIFFAFIRIIEFLIKIAENNIAYQHIILFFVHNVPIVLRNFLGANLLFERIIATIYARNYEQNNGLSMWTIFGISLTIFVSLICCYFGIDINSPTMLSEKMQPVIGGLAFLVLFCIITWYLVYKYNCQKYANIGQPIQNLSERYQLSENIRTFRQLTPTLVLHSFNDYFTILAYFFSTSELIKDAQIWQMINALTLLIIAVSNLLIEISIITFHPTLFRFAYQKLLAFKICRPILGRGRVQSIQTMNIPKNINGEELVNRQNGDEYFKTLQKYWA